MNLPDLLKLIDEIDLVKTVIDTARPKIAELAKSLDAHGIVRALGDLTAEYVASLADGLGSRGWGAHDAQNDATRITAAYFSSYSRRGKGE